MKSFKKKLQVLAVAAALGAGVAGNAQAGVAAQSVLELTGITFLNPDASVLNISQLPVLIFSDNTDIKATLNGVSASGAASNTVGGATLNLAQQCVGTCAFVENDYTHHGFLSPPLLFARGDTLLADSPIAGTGAPVGAHAHTLAEAQLSPTNTGSDISNLGLLATFAFGVQAAQTVTVVFSADQYLIAGLTPDQKIGSNAQASSSWTVSVVRASDATEIFEWTPDGKAGGITGGTENSDPCDLTRTISSNLPGLVVTVSCSGAFSATTPFLVPGEVYLLNLTHASAANAQAVPEPSAIALLGLGLLGMGYVGTRRRNRKPAA